MRRSQERRGQSSQNFRLSQRVSGFPFVQHPQVVDGQYHGAPSQADGGEMNVAGNVNDVVRQALDFPPDAQAVDQARCEVARYVNMGSGGGRPGAVHGPVGGFNAEIPQAARLAHHPNYSAVTGVAIGDKNKEGASSGGARFVRVPTRGRPLCVARASMGSSREALRAG